MTIISKCTASIIKDAALALKEGHLVAFPTETVYGLGADATNEKAVARIYEVKGRPTDHPLIVHISSMELMDKWAREIPEYAIKLARVFWPGPMTLILPRTGLAKDFITGGQDNVGIRVPAHTIALTLLEEFEAQGGLGVAAPSANRFGAVSPTSAKAVEIELDDFLDPSDQILDGGSSQVGIESTIINCTRNSASIMRPGFITKEMIEETLGSSISSDYIYKLNKQVKAPGSHASHYSPKARVLLTGQPQNGDGLIALDKVKTPKGVIRLASPLNTKEYAFMLYEAFRKADSLGIKKVFAILTEDDEISLAIKDRLVRANSKYIN
jgi:L-threonylcarbamoyladenylate synthase